MRWPGIESDEPRFCDFDCHGYSIDNSLSFLATFDCHFVEGFECVGALKEPEDDELPLLLGAFDDRAVCITNIADSG